MEQDLAAQFARLRAELADQAFGDLASVSGKTLQRFSNAAAAGADNLLAKAAGALHDGDEDRARALVDKAARLPFDDHGESLPAAWSVHMMLFNAVTDAVEEAEPDGMGWLAAAEEVLTHGEEPARYDMRDVLLTVDHDYQLSAHEHRRLRAAVQPIPERVELGDLRVPPDELAREVMGVLRGCEMYRSALER